MERAERRSPEILLNNGVLLDKATLYTLVWPLGRYKRFVEEAGYDGLEWIPPRVIFPAAFQLQTGLASEARGVIRTAHQSYSTEKITNFRQNLRYAIGALRGDPKALVALGSLAFLQQDIASLDGLEKIQRTLGRRLPVVVYPTTQIRDEVVLRPFGEKMFQPTPEVMRLWGVKNAEELVAEAKRRGYTGLCVDFYHLREKDERGDLSNWQETLPVLLDFAKTIHMAGGREDLERPYIDGRADLRDLLIGERKSEQSRMLELTRQTGWQGRVGVEVPAAALRQIDGSATPDGMVESHKRITETVAGFLA